jgi:Holliday junction resolvasome RuvABC endonuclease subunit
MKIRILALDLSITATGVVTPWGMTSDGRIWEENPLTIVPKSKGDQRLIEIADVIYAMAKDTIVGVDLVVMEDLPPTRAFSTAKLGMLHGAVRAMLMACQKPYLAIPPSSVKKYATGKGNSPKPTLRMELYKRAGLDLADDNQVDACWLWIMGMDLAGDSRYPQLPKTHRVALDSLRPHFDALLERRVDGEELTWSP